MRHLATCLFTCVLLSVGACKSDGPCDNGPLSECSGICPAGTSIDYSSSIQNRCEGQAGVEITMETEGGSGAVGLECQVRGDTYFVCKPMPNELCQQYGVKRVTAAAVECNPPH